MRTTRILALLSFLGLSLTAIGCGGSGTDDGFITEAQDMAQAIFRVQSGDYKVTTVTKASDTCMINLDDPANMFVGHVFPLTNDGHYNFTLGPVVGTPPQPSQGQGMVGNVTPNMGTLTRDNMVMDATTGCNYRLQRTNAITVTGDNALTVQLTENDTMHTTVCMPVKTDCSANYTFTLVKM